MLVIVDARSDAPPDDADAAIQDALPPALPRFVVHNKIDLAGIAPAVEMRADAGATERRHVFLSAKTGAGVELLQHEILAQAGAHEDMEGTFLARERHLAALRDGESRARGGGAPSRIRTAPARALRRGAARARKSRWPRSPANSPPMTCWARSSRASASANERDRATIVAAGSRGARGRRRGRRALQLPPHADSVDARAARHDRVPAGRGRARGRAPRRAPDRPVDHRHLARSLLHAARRARGRRLVVAARPRRSLRDRPGLRRRSAARAARPHRSHDRHLRKRAGRRGRDERAWGALRGARRPRRRRAEPADPDRRAARPVRIRGARPARRRRLRARRDALRCDGLRGADGGDARGAAGSRNGSTCPTPSCSVRSPSRFR